MPSVAHACSLTSLSGSSIRSRSPGRRWGRDSRKASSQPSHALQSAASAARLAHLFSDLRWSMTNLPRVGMMCLEGTAQATLSSVAEANRHAGSSSSSASSLGSPSSIRMRFSASENTAVSLVSVLGLYVATQLRMSKPFCRVLRSYSVLDATSRTKGTRRRMCGLTVPGELSKTSSKISKASMARSSSPDARHARATLITAGIIAGSRFVVDTSMMATNRPIPFRAAVRTLAEASASDARNKPWIVST
mmetsp:Transcript_9827/g.23052  ORF Transcript_9827/g.23052 Transcript_9827/m.23052 type:complete len:249 (+) Transcript_9827:535-1281(+)